MAVPVPYWSLHSPLGGNAGRRRADGERGQPVKAGQRVFILRSGEMEDDGHRGKTNPLKTRGRSTAKLAPVPARKARARRRPGETNRAATTTTKGSKAKALQARAYARKRRPPPPYVPWGRSRGPGRNTVVRLEKAERGTGRVRLSITVRWSMRQSG